MKIKKFYENPSIEVIEAESSVILVGSYDSHKKDDVELDIDLEEIEEEGFAD